VTVYSSSRRFYFMSFIITLHTISLCVSGLRESRKGRLNYCVDRCACAGGVWRPAQDCPDLTTSFPHFWHLSSYRGKKGKRRGVNVQRKCCLKVHRHEIFAFGISSPFKATQYRDLSFSKFSIFPSNSRKCSLIFSVGVHPVYSALYESLLRVYQI
jgi:hypothetical protein